MIASPPFVRAIGQPVQAGPGCGMAPPLLAAAPLPPVTGAPLRAGRDLPVPAPAPKVVVASRVPSAAAARSRSVARGASLMSVALHLGLVAGWAVLASPARPLLVPDLEAAEVDLISEAAFMALTAPQPQIVLALAPSQPVPLTPSPDSPFAKGPLAAEPPIAAPIEPLIGPLTVPQAPDLPGEAVAADPAPVADAAPELPTPELPARELPKAEVRTPKPASKMATKTASQTPKADKPKAQQQKPKEAPAETSAKPKTAKPKTQSAADAPAPAAASGGEAKALKADWGAKVRSQINRKLALPKGLAPGRTTLRVVIAPSGALVSVEIAKSSGQPALDAAALRAVKAAAPYPRAPKGLSEPSYGFSIPIRQDG